MDKHWFQTVVGSGFDALITQDPEKWDSYPQVVNKGNREKLRC